MDKKLTDNEIIKALECCIGDTEGKNCFDCPLYEIDDCQVHMYLDALNLINRLQAQNKELSETVHNLTIEKDALFDKAEELKAEVEKLNKEIQIAKDAYTMLQAKIEIIKSEAYKECIEKVKNYIKTHCNPYGKPDFDYDTSIKILNFIDNLKKELVGEEK